MVMKTMLDSPNIKQQGEVQTIKSCILHIGMNKAGSSAIQEYLYKNDLGPSFYYTDLGSANHSSMILSLFSHNPESKHDYIKRGFEKKEIEAINASIKERLIKEFSRSEADNYIISGEGILHLKEEELKDLKSFLENYFSKVTVVAYVREPWSFIESLYQQCLKGGLIDHFDVSPMYPRYRQTFAKFYSVFGGQNVNLWQYDKHHFVNQNIVNDFCSRIGIKCGVLQTKRTNPSLSMEATALLYLNRQFFPYGTGGDAIERNNKMIDSLRTIGDEKFEIHHSVIEPILQKHNKDIEWIEEKLGEGLRIKTGSPLCAVISGEDLYYIARSSVHMLYDRLPRQTDEILDEKTIAKRVETLKAKKKELCVLHIGMPKTGSTSIQQALHNGILDEKVAYANLEDANHGIALISLFMKKPLEHHYFKKRGWTQEQIDKFNEKNKRLLVEGFEDHSTSIEIISGEDIYHFPKRSLIDMKRFLEKYFEKIMIVGYVRPPKSFMESAFQQLVKFNNLGKFDFFIVYHPYKKFEKFDEVFGEENVKLLKFTPEEFPESDILLDFYNHLGIEGKKSGLGKANETLSQEAIAILFTYNYFGGRVDFGVYNVPIEHKLVTLLRSVGTTKFRFSSQLVKSVLAQRSEDIQWIENRMGISLQEDYKSEGIGSEEELLNDTMKSIPELKVLLDDNEIQVEQLNNTPQDIVLIIDALRVKLAREMGIA